MGLEQIYHHVVDCQTLEPCIGRVRAQCFRRWAKMHRHVDEVDELRDPVLDQIPQHQRDFIGF